MLDGFVQAMERFRTGGTGVRDWSVYSSESRRFNLGTKDGQTGNVHAPLGLSEACSARYLMVWDDGLVSRGLLERRQLEADPDSALAQARLAAYDDPDAARVLGPAPIPDVELHDDEAAETARGKLGRIVLRLEVIRSMVRDRGFRTWSGSIGAGLGRSELRTSAGLEAAGNGTTFGWWVTLNGELGDGFGGRALDDEDGFAARLERLANTVEALDRDATPLPAGTHDVLLHPNVVESYVLGTILGNLDGSTVAHGEGHFRREQFERGELVLRDDLSLRMDPLQPLRSGSYRFTMEGLPASPCTYIENGRLVTPVLNLKYANRLGMEPTCGPGDMDGLYLEGPPDLDEKTALAEAAGGAVVLSVLGVHTQDPASGDFSLSSPQCLRLGPEGPEGRLRATISGNLWEILGGDDLRLVRFQGEHTPGLLIRCRLDS